MTNALNNLTYREKIFGASMDDGSGEYNISDIDWLFTIGLPKLKIIVILGSKARAGSLYISQYCERLIVITENEYAMNRLRGIAQEEGLENITFELEGKESYSSLKGFADYVAIFENLEDYKKRKNILLRASEIISDKGIISFFLRGKAASINEKEELEKISLNYSEVFWAIPSVWRPTWSGKLDEKETFRIWLDIIDLYNTPPFIPLWARCVIFSRPGRSFLKFIWFFLFPFRKYLFKERYIFASKKNDCFKRQLSNLFKGPFVRKSKASKEGRILFFLQENRKKTVLYFSKLRQYEPLLLNELARNNHTICPVTPNRLSDGATFLVSNFIPGQRLNIYSAMDKEIISWLVCFQNRTFLGYWKETDWRTFILSRTSGCADSLVDRFLILIKKENRSISIVAEHGDFDYLNILKKEDKRYIFDWEYYNERGDEFFDIGYFLLNMYTEKLMNNEIALRDFIVNDIPAKKYTQAFMEAKGLKDIDIMICGIGIAAIRTKHQSLYYASVKDKRFWSFDKVIIGITDEVLRK